MTHYFVAYISFPCSKCGKESKEKIPCHHERDDANATAELLKQLPIRCIWCGEKPNQGQDYLIDVRPATFAQFKAALETSSRSKPS